MTLAEVEAILGRPAGDYGSRPPETREIVFELDEGERLTCEIRWWWGKEAVIFVRLGIETRTVTDKTLVEEFPPQPTEPNGFLNRLSHLLLW
jgi:hypothetical protein